MCKANITRIHYGVFPSFNKQGLLHLCQYSTMPRTTENHTRCMSGKKITNSCYFTLYPYALRSVTTDASFLLPYCARFNP